MELIIFDTIARAAATKNRKTRETILKAADSTLLRKYLRLVLDPQHNFYMTKKGLPEAVKSADELTLSDMFHLLEAMRDRFYDAAIIKDMVALFLGSASPALRGLFNWAIDRQLPGNLGATTVNNCFQGLIYQQPYGGVKSFDPEKVHTRFDWSNGVYLQKKADGFSLFVGKSPKGTISAHTRQGQDVTNQMLPHLQRLFNYLPWGEMVHFEIGLYRQDGTVMPRTEANGIFTSVFMDVDAPKTLDIWACGLDIIDWEHFYKGIDPIRCWKRYDRLRRVLHGINKQRKVQETPDTIDLFPVECRTVDSFEEAISVVRGWIRDGEEGGVLKDTEADWRDTKMTSQMKLKNEFECTLRVVDYVAHKKHPSWVGSLICVSEATLSAKRKPMIKTKVGSGLNEDPDSPLYRCAGPDAFMNKCIEVKAECISKHNALQHPRITDVRIDKADADTYDEVVAAYYDSIWKEA